jgi:hypothetical protein
MVEMYGQENFDFHPKAFLLPDNHEKLVKFMEINKKPMTIKPQTKEICLKLSCVDICSALMCSMMLISSLGYSRYQTLDNK